MDPEMVKQQIIKRGESEKFTQKFPNKHSYEIQKTESLLNYLKNYIQKTLDEYSNFISNTSDLKNRILPDCENKKYFNEYNSLSDDCYTNLIDNNRLVYFKNLENLASKIAEDNLNKNNINEFLMIRFYTMNKINPKFILRNYIAQEVIEEAENGNYSDLNKLLNILMTPFEEHEELDYDQNYSPNFEKAFNICISCSS